MTITPQETTNPNITFQYEGLDIPTISESALESLFQLIKTPSSESIIIEDTATPVQALNILTYDAYAATLASYSNNNPS